MLKDISNYQRVACFMPAHFCTVIFLAIFSMFAAAAAPVSEIGVKTQAAATINVSKQSLPPDPHYQGQLLREEVKTLRGMVEELKNDISRLSKQQKDNYLDLDRRLSTEFSKSELAVIPSDEVISKNQKLLLVVKAEKESDHYDNAYAYLKSGEIDKAISKFKTYVSAYPKGVYVPNAHYWLGEIYLLQNELDLARQSFSIVHDNYTAHRKFLGSKFKLGQVYFMQGDKARAKSLLENIAIGDSNIAVLARKFIDINF